jgi:hypothetical protein
MTFTRSTRLAALFAATLAIAACTADTSFRGRVESYIAQNIADLSPRTATYGDFTVSDIEWVDDDTVRIRYADDADIELTGIADVTDDNGTVLVRNFRIDTSGLSSSSSSSISFSSSMSFSFASTVSASSANTSGMTSSVTSGMSASSLSSSLMSASSMTTVSSVSSYSL